jgi:hypothetical protein
MRHSKSEREKEDWMNSKWRPMMGWMYMSVCMFDFMIAPILWSLIQAGFHGSIQTQWQPLTLQGAGLFHIAMGAVLGIAAFGRTQEKLNGANNGGFTPPIQSSFSQPNSFNTPNNFSSPTPTFTTPRPTPMGFGGGLNVNVNVDPSDPPARNTRND